MMKYTSILSLFKPSISQTVKLQINQSSHYSYPIYSTVGGNIAEHSSTLKLYAAVKKNVKGSAMEEEEGAPQIPPHTIEELYTAVVKKPKISETDNAPSSIPSHSIEETYTDVQKCSAAKNKQEVPPISPLTVEDMHLH